VTTAGSQPLRIALIGTGAIAVEAHLPAWRVYPSAEIVWAIDVRADAARRTAEQWGIPRWGTDFQAVLDDTGVDAVDICTPAFAHAEQTLRAVQAGKHVLVEKPVAPTIEEAEAMARAGRESGRIIMVAENWPYASATRRVEELLAEGVLGEPYLLYASHESGLRLVPPARPGQGDRARLGYLFAAGIHSLNLARVLMGEYVELSAFATPAEAAPDFNLPNENDLVLAARFERGGLGSFHFTGRAHRLGPRRLGFRVFGTQGTVDFDILSGAVDWTAGGARTLVQEAASSMGFQEQIAHFVECVQTGRTPRTSVEDQLATLRVVYAAYEAAATGRTVKLAVATPQPDAPRR
jgi:predicted dehydrogenase